MSEKATIEKIVGAVKALEKTHDEMVNIINDLYSKINLLTQIIGSQVQITQPDLTVTDAEIIARMEKDGITWEESRYKLIEEKKNEGAEETLHVPI